MSKIYLDNAATTRLDAAVLEAMLPYLTENFGNPSSIHSHGRQVRNAIEKARKTVAGLINASPSEIFFTSGGTEADNTAIHGSIYALGLKHAITSRTEHHAVLHTLEHLAHTGIIQLSYVKLDNKGHVDLEDLDRLLQNNPRSLVSLMHGNNEIGNLSDIHEIAKICKKHNAIFHSDTVQTMGHYKHDMQACAVDFIIGAAHKFHGPKGVGFLYINSENKIPPFVHGGSQERNMRGGTENVYGIIGLAKALEISYQEMDKHRSHIELLKKHMIESLKNSIPGVEFNGDSANIDKSLYTVLNVSLPPSDDNEMLLFNLDIKGISCSGGSACTSGTEVGSHVLAALGVDNSRGNVRFSFGKYNTIAEIDSVIEALKSL